MTLDKNKLQADIKKAFEASKEAEDADEATVILAQALATAIDTYTRGGEVKQVKVDLNTGKQTGSVKLE